MPRRRRAGTDRCWPGAPTRGTEPLPPLELFYDLVFVVAIAQAAAGFHHALAEDHWQSGLLGYAMVFFAIWWTWLNFAWFASAYDTDDTPYRIAVMVQMAGALILAAGIEPAFEDQDFMTVIIGYSVIRAAMIAQWFRAARSDPERRITCRRYAIGLIVVQLLWITAGLTVDGTAFIFVWIVLVVAEMAVPVHAERAEPTTWHPHHITERYGLLTIIVLGETILAATMGVRGALEIGHDQAQVLVIAVGGLVIVFSMWWLYFDRPAHDLLTNLRMAFRWGYGHYIIFGSAAAVGAGLEVVLGNVEGESHLSDVAAAAPLTIAVAVYVLSVWALQVLPREHVPLRWAYPACAVLAAFAAFAPQPVVVVAALLAALVVWTVAVNHREALRASSE